MMGSPFAKDAVVANLKMFAQETKRGLTEEIAKDPDYAGEVDLLLAMAQNLEEDIGGLKDNQELEKLDIKRQARIFASLSTMTAMMQNMDEDDLDDFDDFDGEDDEDDDDDEDDHPHGGGKSIKLEF